MKMKGLNYFVLFLGVFVGACNMDNLKQKGMVGTYKVNAEFDKKKLDNFKKELESSIDKGKREVGDANIDYEINGEKGKIDVSEGVNKLLSGIEKMVEGVADISSGALDAVLNGLDTEVTLEENGQIRFHTKNLNLSHNATFWKIQDGDFVVLDKENKETSRFKVETKGTDVFLLKNKDITFKLKRVK